MGLQMLIAVSDEAKLEQLCVIYSNSPLVTGIDEITNSEQLCHRLKNTPPDFAMVDQSLMSIMNILLLPGGHFNLLAAKPDWDILIAGRNHGMRGYFLKNPLPLEGLLTASLSLRGEQCLLDPRLTSWALHCVSPVELPPVTETLTTREQQVLVLWNEHLSSRIIGEHLNISERTVKKHLENIRKKLREHDSLALMR